MKPRDLQTATLSYREFINGRHLRVPPFQRSYAWTVESWDDLWNDLMDVRLDSADRHFMGPIVLRYDGDEWGTIIDGQQRVATLSVLTLAVIDKLGRLADAGVDTERNGERARRLRDRYVGQMDHATLIESSRLRLSAADDGFYQDELVQLRPPVMLGSMPPSNARLWDCFCFFKGRLDEGKYAEDGEAIARIVSDTVALGLFFLVVTVSDELDAYTVFETLNARGVPLTTAYLLRNAIFQRVRVPARRDILERRWVAILDAVGAERFADFLRYHLLCEQAGVHKVRVYRMVHERLTDSQASFELLNALLPRAELFAALEDPAHELWGQCPQARTHVRELALLPARQSMPLLFAAWERFPADDFERVLNLVTVITVRALVCGRNGNTQEAAYAEVAREVLSGKLAEPRAVFNGLRTIYVDDDTFENAFAWYAVQGRRNLLKYLLGKLEADAGGIDLGEAPGAGSIEHILPQNPAGDWSEAFTPQQVNRAIDRLGNATLLEPAVNRRLGGAPYPEKCQAYLDSAFALTRQIPDAAPDEWTFDDLASRQRRMAKRAVQVWRSDFA